VIVSIETIKKLSAGMKSQKRGELLLVGLRGNLRLLKSCFAFFSVESEEALAVIAST